MVPRGYRSQYILASQQMLVRISRATDCLAAFWMGPDDGSTGTTRDGDPAQ